MDIDIIRTQLERILASEPFTSAARLSRLLRYVVERTLAGEQDQLKEYVVGVEVFDRDERYDPRLDSIVRVEARRLRSKLEEYYAGPGADDPVVISMPRGGYIPVFKPRPPVSVAAPGPTKGGTHGWRATVAALTVLAAIVALAMAWQSRGADDAMPVAIAHDYSIAVLPFANYSADESETLLAARITDGVTVELARLGSVGVVSHQSALQFTGRRRPAREVAQALDADVLLESSLEKSGNQITIEARIVDGITDRKVWVGTFNGDLGDLHGLQRRIAADVSAAALSHQSRQQNK